LITADNALRPAAGAKDRTFKGIDAQFEEVIHMLCCFEKDFPSEEQTSDPNIGNGEGRTSDWSKSPSTILYALKKSLHANVKFLSFFISQH
jgi:hypothetical protein